MTTNFFSPLSFVAVFGSGVRDPGSGMGKNQDPGSGINIPDPQHCKQLKMLQNECYVLIKFVYYLLDQVLGRIRIGIILESQIRISIKTLPTGIPNTDFICKLNNV
jgi:hypothetical protein